MRPTRSPGWLALAMLFGCAGDEEGGTSSTASVASWTGVYANGHPLTASTSESETLSLEAETLDLVNAHRVSLGLNALVEDPPVADVARAHSGHMIVHDFFDHVNPEGYSPGDRASLAGVGWSYYGENIAAGYDTPQAAFNAWMNSPGHRENIERAEWTHAGMGYARGPSTWTHYWTNNFRRD